MYDSGPFTCRVGFKFSVNSSSGYISICLSFKENPTSGDRDTTKKVVLLLDIYLDLHTPYTGVPLLSK